MIKNKTQKKRTIDLTGPEGNAFYLLGVAQRFSHQLRYDTDKILEEMGSGDYENLIKVFDNYFGKFVDLER
ncbi:hypothetical protein M0R04_04525 [Candidatus Dojkabacteria bacterium]|nr:hypothetical protein [Candidatus Dojkabacteria bacterium]